MLLYRFQQGGGAFFAPCNPCGNRLQSVQTALNEAGYDCGTPDGIAGRNTQAAISAFQQDNGLNETGTATHELLLALGIIEE